MLFLDVVAETYINMCSLKQDPTFSILLIELSNRATLVLKHQGSALCCRQGFLHRSTLCASGLYYVTAM